MNLQITSSDIRPHIKFAVSLVIAYGHFNLPPVFVWACMGQHTHFITPEGWSAYGGGQMKRFYLIQCTFCVLFTFEPKTHFSMLRALQTD